MTVCTCTYESNLVDPLTLASNGKELVGCWFAWDKSFGYGVKEEMEPSDDDVVLGQACDWLDRYFAGKRPDPRELPLNPGGSAFQKSVWKILEQIPYGQMTTYGQIAKQLVAGTDKKMSAQAVGGAVGHNPICVIIPCHRVMGAAGNLTGYGLGTENIPLKVKLLQHEGVETDGFRFPKGIGRE